MGSADRDVGAREETSLVDIALDPNMYYRTMPTVRTLDKAAELGFEYVELSPNADFHFWHHRPVADDGFVAELNKAQKETGVKVRTLNPVFNWSSPDEGGAVRPGVQLAAPARAR